MRYSAKAECHYAVWHHAAYHCAVAERHPDNGIILILGVIVLGIVALSVVLLSTAVLNIVPDCRDSKCNCKECCQAEVHYAGCLYA